MRQAALQGRADAQRRRSVGDAELPTVSGPVHQGRGLSGKRIVRFFVLLVERAQSKAIEEIKNTWRTSAFP